MADGKVQIFVSYAHNDNLGRTTNGERADQGQANLSRGQGFVDFLHERLQDELDDQGYPAKIWRDPRIGPADRFGPIIQNAIATSSVFVAIMSRNWLASDYCREELELFLEQWKADDARERLVVVTKHHVDPGDWPSALQGQRGIQFYSLDRQNETVPETEYFWRGEVRDERYWGQFKALARALGHRAQRFGSKIDPLAQRPKIKTLREQPNNGRTIYLAKPANDMRRAYDSIVKELVGRGYTIVPDPHTELPYDSLASATEIVDKALAAAEVSVHLLGQSAGFLHDGSTEPLVKLQLRLAAAKAPPFQDRSDTRNGFHRIVWAPSILDDGADSPPSDAKRDPCAVLAAFDRQLPGDCVEGDTLGNLVDFLSQHLVREAPARKVLEKIEAQSKIYVYHPEEDTDYAFSVAKVLRLRNIEALLPAFDDTPSAQTQLHRQYLRDCDSVILCWAAGSETWAKVNSHALVDWQNLGRTKEFSRRGLVAGPPPGMRKRMFVELYPKNEIDVVVDLTGRAELTPEDLNPLFDTA